MPAEPFPPLRSRHWFETDPLNTFRHRSRLKQMGYSAEDFAGKPVIGILNTWSDLNPCHRHFRTRAEEVKRGVWQAGGFPVEIPVTSVSETYMQPSPLIYRNLLAMETEEVLRSQPIDGVVLMGGCDKTTPALLMGAISMGLPSIFLPAGPMLRGNWLGRVLGSGSDQWKFHDERRAGRITEEEWAQIEDGIARSDGHCMTMGTASTMTAVAEVLGFTLPGASSIPAVDANHARMATDCGRRSVELVREDLRPATILNAAAFDDAITTMMALGGSTNGFIHLIALAGRAGFPLGLDRFDEIARRVPVLANLRPAGEFLMEDFFYAGGLRGLLSRLKSHLTLDRPTVNGRTLAANLENARVFNDDVIRPLDRPLHPPGAFAVLRGNLAPRGCVIKVAAADPRLLRHTGPAVVFDDYTDLKLRIDHDDLEVTADSVLILRNAGPLGAPGMPEWGQLPVPRKLLAAGVRDIVRISDARMSGTSYGTCILHVCPESAIGGPLALVRSGDLIELDVGQRRLELLVEAEELERRRMQWRPAPAHPQRGFGALYAAHVTQADEGCDFDILRATTNH